eukprot:CAMPEP_0174969214 /NCGR_PEP_ID=MMETSP0004_2-20121128/8617_1 /TAXON_ID=420556 /ORGANISM="Ochromonas sp., Strain CCMP1393" /LENGTH=257 /DNA_ID=CAMNT_0016218637 /DNA_START=408 /DNA_END=1181 /DNA_ORIENTATION=-
MMNDTFAQILVTNYPNSGSSWFKHLAFGVRGVFTESVYLHEGRVHTAYNTATNMCMLGNDLCSTDLVKKFNATHGGIRTGNMAALIKTHHATIRKATDGIVTFTRNPIDNVIGNDHFLSRNLNESRMHRESDFFRAAFDEYLNWHWKMATNVRSQCLPVLHIKYEDLLVYSRTVLMEIMQFIGEEYTAEAYNRSLEMYPPHRHGSYSSEVFNYVDTIDSEQFNWAIEKMHEYASKMEAMDIPYKNLNYTIFTSKTVG